MAFSSYNCSVTVDTVAIGEVTSLSLSGMSRSEIEATDLTSTIKVLFAGVSDPGSIEVGVNFIGQAALLTVLDGPTSTPSAIVLTFAEVGAFTGTGYVTAGGVEASVDGVITGTLTIRLTSTLTYAAA